VYDVYFSDYFDIFKNLYFIEKLFIKAN